MINIVQGIRLTENNIRALHSKGIRIPNRAVNYDYMHGTKKGETFDICIFKGEDKLPVKRLKTTVDDKTQEKKVQARFYHYLGSSDIKGKLSEINQYEFNSKNECINAVNWRFYHPKKGKVRYSMNINGEKKHNFIQANGTYTDKQGFTVRPISIAEYLDIKRDIGRKKYIDEPWTCRESITSDEAVTDAIQECTAVGIVGRKGISLNHLNPNNPRNRVTRFVNKTLSSQIEEQGEDAKAFLIGSCEDYESRIQFKELDDFFTTRNIKHSKYKTGSPVLYLSLDELSMVSYKDRNKLKLGEVTPFYYQSGQHIAYKDNEIKLSNLIIDKEMDSGNLNPSELIKKSFTYYDK